MGALAIDKEGRIFYYNRYMAKLDDLSPEETLGYKISEAYSVRDDESPTMEALRTGKPVLERYMNYKTARGRQLASLNSAYPLVVKGEVVGALCLSLEITDLLRHLSGAPATPAKRVATAPEGKVDFSSIIGKNPLFREALDVAKIAARGPSHVMIVGETGTGKDLVANAIHNCGPRASGSFVPINCSAIPEPLLEGLLFGTTKGAFTGAEDRPGLFEHASGGTLFLDELSSMPTTLQAKLLRVIQDQRVRRVGGLAEKKIDARIVSAVSGPPRDLVAAERLRPDLYFRLGVVQVAIPPLRERLEDIPELARFFVAKITKRLGLEIAGLAPDVMRVLQSRSWPGNIRELEHVLESALNFVASGETLDLRHLKRAARHWESGGPAKGPSPDPGPFGFGQGGAGGNSGGSQGRVLGGSNGDGPPKRAVPGLVGYSLKRDLLEYEKSRIVDVLRKHGGNLTSAAAELGISQQLLVYKRKKFNLFKKMFR